jgi:hypothetical protein
MNKLVILIFISTLVVSGCDSDSGPDYTSSTLIPLKEGNYWVYENSVYDSIGTLLGRAYDTITIGNAVTIDGQIWYEELRSGFIVPADSSRYSNRSDGVWGRYVLSAGAFTNFLYKYPTAINDTFALTRSASFPPDETFERTFKMTVATNTPVIVPAGTFSALHYRYFIQAVDSVTMEVKRSLELVDEYVAPGVGLVKSTSQSSFTTGHPDSLRVITRDHERVLVKYSLK